MSLRRPQREAWGAKPSSPIRNGGYVVLKGAVESTERKLVGLVGYN